MKRSNRLVLLIGVFLAVIAFVGVLVLSQGGGGGGGTPQEPTEATVVVAVEEIPLGTVIESTMLTTKTIPIDAAETDAYLDISQVVGQVARQEVLPDQQLTRTITSGGGTTIVDLDVPAGQRAMSILVDKVTGVGTLIKTGDYVDMVVRVKIKGIDISETGQLLPAETIEDLEPTSTKLVLQGMQVLGISLPPPPVNADGSTPPPGSVVADQELVILSVTPAQAEVVKWFQSPTINPEWIDGTPSISLLLRSPADFVDAQGNRLTAESPCTTVRPTPTPTPLGSPAPSESEAPVQAFPCEVTPGVVLSTLVEDYGVLVPHSVGNPGVNEFLELIEELAQPELSPTPEAS